jgi:hypothetical protein
MRETRLGRIIHRCPPGCGIIEIGSSHVKVCTVITTINLITIITFIRDAGGR